MPLIQNRAAEEYSLWYASLLSWKEWTRELMYSIINTRPGGCHYQVFVRVAIACFFRYSQSMLAPHTDTLAAPVPEDVLCAARPLGTRAADHRAAPPVRRLGTVWHPAGLLACGSVRLGPVIYR